MKFLPVNEIENFAILIDSDFTNEFIKQDGDKFDKIKDAFWDTANENIKDCLKYCETNEKNKFNGQARHMRDCAKSDIRSLFPGKNICKLKPKLNAEHILKDLSIEDFPQPLKEYLTDIKSFFYDKGDFPIAN